MNMHRSVFKDHAGMPLSDLSSQQRRVHRGAVMRQSLGVMLLATIVFVAGMAVTNWDAITRTVPVYYGSCSEARAAGAAQISRASPAYGAHLDEDGDGIACEPFVED